MAANHLSPATKTCHKCGAEKSLGEFYKNTSSKDGKCLWCKQCSRESANHWFKANPERAKTKDKAYRVANKERANQATKSWRAKNPESVRAMNKADRAAHPKPISAQKRRWAERNQEYVAAKDRKEYLANAEQKKRSAREWYKSHPTEARERAARYYAEHRAEFIAKALDWNRNHPENRNAWREVRRKADGKFTGSDVRALYAQQSGLCANPNCQKALNGKFHIDHIIPIKKGGAHWPSNLQLLCQRCNHRKGTRIVVAW
jgi:5-methylcytosine-specific restriction endonuclease McrA